MASSCQGLMSWVKKASQHGQPGQHVVHLLSPCKDSRYMQHLSEASVLNDSCAWWQHYKLREQADSWGRSFAYANGPMATLQALGLWNLAG